MMNKKAFTIVEMLISLVIASILVLTVGMLSSLAMSTSSQLRKEAEVFNEVMHGLKSIQKGVREANACTIVPQASPWVSEQLECDNIAYGVYLNSSTNSRELVYLADKFADPDIDDNRDILFFAPNPDLTMTMTSTISGMEVTITGEKDNTAFNLNTVAIRRR